MELKGDLESIGLAELFKTLASQDAAGVLSVAYPCGGKLLSLSPNEVVVCTDSLSQHPRLGELLIIQGKVSDSQLRDATRIQRESGYQKKLGEVLVNRGVVQPADLAAAMKFQFEEEIWELLTWKGATFEFQGGRSINDSDFAAEHILRFPADMTAFIEGLPQRMTEWKQIETRLPSQYLCFKLSAKGESLLVKAGDEDLRVLKLVQEGCAIESIVTRSCLGRFSVCNIIIRLLEDGNIFPYPSSELRYLASEHRSQRRYSDALYIYRRLHESADSEAERRALEDRINEATEALRRAAANRGSTESAEIISHKQAALVFKRRQGIRRMAIAAYCAAAAIAAGVMLAMRYSPRAQLPESYKKASQDSDQALAANKFDEADKIWNDFYAQIPDKGSEIGKLVTEKLASLPRKREVYLNERLAAAAALEAAGNLDAAEAAYNRLKIELGGDSAPQSIQERLHGIAAKKAVLQEERARKELAAQVAEAEALLLDKNWAAARSKFAELATRAPQDSPSAAAIGAGLKRLLEEEARCANALKAAEAELAAKKTDKALAAFQRVAGEWAGFEGAARAREQIQGLNARRRELDLLLKRAGEAESQGRVMEALAALKEAVQDFGDFESAAGAKARAVLLENKAGDATRALDQARAACKAGDFATARRLFKGILDNNAQFLAGVALDLPVRIASNPPGARVSINGKEHGLTPQETLLPAFTPLKLDFEKPGYTAEHKSLERLTGDDLEIQTRLKREPIAIVSVGVPVFAPPAADGQTLYLMQGTSMVAYDLNGKASGWALQRLLDDSAGLRPNPQGNGPDIFVDDKSWWHPRRAPKATGNGKLLLALRSRDVLEVDVASKERRKLFELPIDPTGQFCYEPSSLLNGKPVIVIPCSDGIIRGYVLEEPARLLWTRLADPENKKGALATGLARHGADVLALSSTGRLSRFNLIDGAAATVFAVNASMSQSSDLPRSPNDATAVLVHSDGRATAVDVDQQQVLWELNSPQALEGACGALVDSSGIYLAMRQGLVQCLSREKMGNPASLWQTALDGSVEVPMALGKALFAATRSTLYALAPSDGRVLWSIPLDAKPLALSAFGDRVYLTTSDGKLWVMSAE